MTRYDEPEASDGHGGPHPLAGVPQSALDAATDAFMAADVWVVDPDHARPIAEAVLMAGLIEIRKEANPL
jgi:hypothetical protein